MIRFLFLALVSCLLGACSVGSPEDLGRRFSATIPGTWKGTSTHEKSEIHAVYQFKTDGTMEGVVMMKKREGGMSMVLPEIPFSGRWRVAGDVAELYAFKTGYPEMLKPGYVDRATVVSVSPNRIVTRSHEKGVVETMVRVTLPSR